MVEETGGRRRGIRPMAVLAIAALAVLDGADAAEAGMPSVTLEDLARMRVQTLSFFGLVLLLSALGVQAIWNGLRADFPRLPRLSYRRAVGLMALWGLLFVLVLTMISGARELMTPGAWRKAGLTYKLADPPESEQPPPPSPGPDLADRRAGLERLKAALWTYARSHDGALPAADDPEALPGDAWRVPDPSGMAYRYLAGRRAGEGSDLVAFEPGLFGPTRLGLRSDGTIGTVESQDLERAVEDAEARP